MFMFISVRSRTRSASGRAQCLRRDLRSSAMTGRVGRIQRLVAPSNLKPNIQAWLSGGRHGRVGLPSLSSSHTWRDRTGGRSHERIPLEPFWHTSPRPPSTRVQTLRTGPLRRGRNRYGRDTLNPKSYPQEGILIAMVPVSGHLMEDRVFNLLSRPEFIIW